jgi:hypothetical protein
VIGMFALAWAWFAALDFTINIERRPHWLILFFGYLAMVGSRAPRFDRLSNLLSVRTEPRSVFIRPAP